MRKIDSFLAWVLMQVIKLYRLILSPDHSFWSRAFPFLGCKDYPSCSSYSLDVLKNQGFFKGVPKIIIRVLKCH